MNELGNRFTEKFYNWIVTYAPRILVAVFILLISQWLIGIFIRSLQKFLAKRRINETLKPFIVNLCKFTLQALLIFGILQLLGIKMTLFAAFIGALGVASGLALSGTLQNFASGVLIILLKPFRIGDNIKTQGEEGTVTAIRLFYTTVVTYNNSTLIVPNGKLSNEVIFNLTLNKERRFDIILKFKIDTDFSKLRSALLEVVHSNKDVLQNPPVRVGITQLESDNYTVVLNVWLKAHGFEDYKMALNEILLTELIKIKGNSV